MTRRTPKQRRSRETVRAILEAAQRLLSTEGPDAISTRRVARVAGVSIGTLYEYFPERESLRKAVEERSWAAVAEELSRRIVALDDGRPLAETIEGVVRFGIEIARERGSVHGFTLDDPVPGTPRLHLEEAITAFVEERLARHAASVRPKNVRLAALVALRAVFALTWVAVRAEDPALASGEMSDEIAALVVRYLVR